MSAPVVKIAELAYTFAGRKTPSLAGINLTLEPGSWTLVAGRTGSGKSTFLRALAGLIPHHAAGTMQGRVELCGLDTRRASTAELARTVGIVFQSPDDQICSSTVAAEVAFGLENLAVDEGEIAARIASALERVGLARFADARTSQLSGGQKQRLLLASILAMEPRILLLDEPLSQLDRATAAELLGTLDELRAQGLTLITAEHRLDEIIDRADRLLVIDDGLLVADLDPRDVPRVVATLAQHDLDPPELYELATQSGRTLQEISVNGGSLPSPLAGEGPGVRGPRASSPPHPNPLPPGEREPPITSLADATRESTSALLRVDQLTHRFAPRGTDLAILELRHSRRRASGTRWPERFRQKHVAGGVGRTLTAERRGHAIGAHRARSRGERTRVAESRSDALLEHGARRAGLRPSAVGARAIRDRSARSKRGYVARSCRNARRGADGIEPGRALTYGRRRHAHSHAALAAARRANDGTRLRQVERVMQAVSDALQEPAAVGAVLFATHDLRSVARYADRVLVLADGRLLADCLPEQLIANDELLRTARLVRTPLLEWRHRRGLRGWTAVQLAEELRP